MRQNQKVLTSLAVAGYRSLRNLVLPLRELNLVTGPNGSGKSSLYRAIRLLADVSQGNLISSLAREGGLQSTLWAGPETTSSSVKRGDYAVEGTTRLKPVTLQMGFASDEFSYAIKLGLPKPSSSAFALDPEIKSEHIWHGEIPRPSVMLVDREGPVLRLRQSEDDEWRIAAQNLRGFDTVFTRLADPRTAPEVLALRDSIQGWRFYDHFRTDDEAPARQSQIGTRTTVLSNDGRDLAAAIETIHETGDQEALAASVEDAFPGSSLSVASEKGRFALKMKQRGLLRPLDSSELSDGTLRYLLWIAALLSPRPPSMMVLNEPETSLHPDLLPALARLIAHAARSTQIITVSHAAPLIAALAAQHGCHTIRLDKDFGETRSAFGEGVHRPIWKWPTRTN